MHLPGKCDHIGNGLAKFCMRNRIQQYVYGLPRLIAGFVASAKIVLGPLQMKPCGGKITFQDRLLFAARILCAG